MPRIAAIPYVVWAWTQTTILPWGGRPPDCRGGSLGRHSARHAESCNHRYPCRRNGTSNDLDDERYNFRNKFVYSSRDSDGQRLRSRLRSSAGLSHRRSSRYSPRHTERYFDPYLPTNNERYIARHNRAFGVRYKSPQVGFQVSGVKAGMTKRQVAMTNQAPLAECQIPDHLPGICVICAICG